MIKMRKRRYDPNTNNFESLCEEAQECTPYFCDEGGRVVDCLGYDMPRIMKFTLSSLTNAAYLFFGQVYIPGTTNICESPSFGTFFYPASILNGELFVKYVDFSNCNNLYGFPKENVCAIWGNSVYVDCPESNPNFRYRYAILEIGKYFSFGTPLDWQLLISFGSGPDDPGEVPAPGTLCTYNAILGQTLLYTCPNSANQALSFPAVFQIHPDYESVGNFAFNAPDSIIVEEV